MILEGILTTANDDGTPHVAAMGPSIDDACRRSPDRMLLRPFQSTHTFANLKRTGEAVFHVTDDVWLVARAAVGRLEPLPELRPAEAVGGWILADACRWYALRVVRIDDSRERAEIDAEVVNRGRIRDYFGLNRAKHAVVEAAILATRTHLLPAEEIRAELARLVRPVEKTGGPEERAAFAFLEDHVRQAIGEAT